ncbi:hypothetical protein [Ideonella sp. A 288]|uniref:hypothetical protein n=1 Tax=Ideonella sp. A 288 TaxID=1962181 RepID=UPI000B4B2B49|nr:hypothetical protein [Ideonella sp. A 288]
MHGTRPMAHARPGERTSPPAQAGDEWAKTRALTALQTQLASDKDDYLAGAGVRQIGRRISDDQHEMFVVCDPAEALQQQLDYLTPDYIALHDIGADTARTMLRMVAAALGAKVQKLAIRRQGFGVTLAALEFVELPSAHGRPPLRVYATRVAAASVAQRLKISHTLLGHSRLGVLLLDSRAPQPELERDLTALNEALVDPAWRSQQVLGVPLTSAAERALKDVSEACRHRVEVLVGEPVGGAGQAWQMIQTVWGQMRKGEIPTLPVAATRAPQVAGTRPPEPPTAVTPPWETVGHGPSGPMPELQLRPMPALRPALTPLAGVPESAWSDYVREVAAIKGMVSCCVFELKTQRPLAHAGLRPGPAALAAQGAALHDMAVATAKSLGLPPGRPELAMSCDEHHLLLQPMPDHPGLMLHAVLDSHSANLTLSRMKLQRVQAPPAG